MAAAPSAPMICAITNAGTWLMAMPANVVVKPRARVTAGLAKDVEDVTSTPRLSPSQRANALTRIPQTPKYREHQSKSGHHLGEPL